MSALGKVVICKNNQIWNELKRRLKRVNKRPETDPELSSALIKQIRRELGFEEERPVIRGF